MSKDQSVILKGVAILMMLWLHLFSNPAFSDISSPVLWIGDLPFATVFARACGPVGFFLVCSGYGLAYKRLHGRLSYGSQLKRVARLYLNYWLILILLVGCGVAFCPEFRLGGLRVVIENFAGWNVDAYDHPAWFLLPYCLLCLSAPLIFGVMDRVGIWRALGVSLALSVLSMYVISRYIAPAKAHHEWYAILFTYFDLLFSFVLGALVCYRNMRSSWTIEWLHSRQWLVRALFLAWFGLHLLTGSALWDVLFLCLFMLLFLNLEIRGRVRRTLLELGSKSMTMWLVHAFVYGTFFHDQIYGLRFPPLIFLGLVFASYVLSIPIMWLARVSIGRIGWLATK
ncbi:beta-carotene 15,15'-monooxygenase [Prevotella sp. S7-1-8]|uniref:acyltransferase family protein n=1 Tax=Prevotella sp. S7-1-8 TaxID=1284775 RepID=UPI00050F3E80|nr:acyltransferase [Prevotella sp. S7-1-8]KGF17843.1 beta-carotene 15,15'-monooxygenase [Prevotella sp. S7-1-8]